MTGSGVAALMAAPSAALGSVFVLFLAAFGIGRIVLKKHVPDPLAALAAGMWLLALAGLAGDLWLGSPFGRACLLCVSGVFALYGLRELYPLLRHHPSLTLACAAGLGVTLGSALLPPWNWDEQVYQTALPFAYLYRGSTAVLPDNPYSAYPSLPHFFLLPLLSSGGVALPRLCVWLLSGLLGVRLWLELRVFGRWIAAALFAALLLSPLSSGLNQAAYAELYTLLFAGAGGAVLFREPGKRSVFLAGFFAGMAMAVKLTGAAVPLMLFCLLLFQREKRRCWPLFPAGALLAVLPFFLRVGLCCGGNFVYPYGSFLFGSEAAVLVEQYHRLLGSARYGLGPVTGTVFGWVFAAARPQLYDGFGTGWQFPLLAVFLAGALWYALRNRHPARYALGKAGIALALGYLFWGFTAQQSRFLYPELCVLLFAAGMAAQKLLNAKRQKIFALFLLLVSLFSISPGRLHHYATAWKLLPAAYKDPERFLLHAGRDPRYMALVRKLAEEKYRGRTALLWERRTLYLPHEGREYTILHPRFQERLTPVPQTAEELKRVLAEFDHVLLAMPERDVDRQEEYVEETGRLLGLAGELVRRGDLVASAPECGIFSVVSGEL